MKFRLPKTRRFRVYLYILSTILILVALELAWVRIDRHITVGYDTTRITSPLAPDGMPDFVKAIDDRYRAGVTPENNAAPLLLQIFGPRDHESHGALNAVAARLGMPPLISTDQTFISIWEFARAHDPKLNDDTAALAAATFDASQHPWRPDEFPRLVAYLQTNQHALDMLQVAVARPRFYMPYGPGPGDPNDLAHLLIPVTSPLYYLRSAVFTRALLRIGTADWDGARADLIAIHRLSRLLSQAPSSIERGTAYLFEWTSMRGDRAFALDASLPPAQAKRFLADLENLPPFPSPVDAVDRFDRFVVLETLIRAARTRPSDVVAENDGDHFSQVPHFRMFLNYSPTNFNAALRRANHFFDRELAIFHEPTFAKRSAAAEAFERGERYDLQKTVQGLPPHGYFDAANFLLNREFRFYPSMIYEYDREITNLDLTRLALALAAYHADHHSYPAALSALAPDYLRAIPQDRFIDSPLHYNVTPGGYLLYSVGPNMTDDGGHNRDRNDAGNPRADDLVVVVGENPATRPK